MVQPEARPIFPKPWIDRVCLEYGLELFDSCRTRRSAEPMSNNPLDDDRRLRQRMEGWVRWSNPVCATCALRRPGPMSP
jgi:hypothetical protein